MVEEEERLEGEKRDSVGRHNVVSPLSLSHLWLQDRSPSSAKRVTGSLIEVAVLRQLPKTFLVISYTFLSLSLSLFFGIFSLPLSFSPP